MVNGLFQSEKQIRDAQFAADAATGAQGINGIMGMIGGDIGRTLSGNVDPRILLAKEFEGKDLNKPEDLMQLMGSANNLGLQSEALQIADRIRTVTPKKEKPTILSQGQKAFNDKGEVLFSNPKEAPKDTTFGPRTSFTDPSGKAVTGQWGSDGKFYKIAEGFNLSTGKGGSSDPKFSSITETERTSAGVIIQNFAARMSGSDKLDLDKPNIADAVQQTAQAIKDYATLHKVPPTVARSVVERHLANELEIGSFSDSFKTSELQDSLNVLLGGEPVIPSNARGRAVQTPALSGRDADALAWAKANPNTRQAKEIRKRLGQ